MDAPSLIDFLDNAQAVAPARPGGSDPRPGHFHRSMPGYARSPLAHAPTTARALGLERLLVKLEVERYGLPSFKILGASWAICRALSARAGRGEPAATFAQLRELAAAQGELTLVAATDGNHGRAVARMARLLGLGAQILVPEHTAAARIEAIAGEGAEVEVVRGSYDDAVALSAAAAGERHLVISDTSWPGYEDVPGWVADGYTTIFEELAAQLDELRRSSRCRSGSARWRPPPSARSRHRGGCSSASSRTTPPVRWRRSARARRCSSPVRIAR